MNKQGLTLIEVLAALIIMGAAVTFTLPNLRNSFELTRAQQAQNNLYAISAAQQKFFEDYNVYCISTGANPSGLTATCGDTVGDLNSNLRLGISDQFTYSCSQVIVGAIPYNCTATDGTDTLTLNPNAVPPTLPVSCLPVGNTCP